MSDIFVYRTIDGNDIEGVLHRSTTKMAPLLIFLHGGGLIWGTKTDMHKEQIRRYTNAGFHVFSANYRLAPETKLPAIREDIEHLLKWVKTEAPTHFEFDSDHIAVVGSSAGGYLALLSGTFNLKPDAIVSFYGYGRLTENWYQEPSPYFSAMPKVPKLLADQLIQHKPITEAIIQQRYAIYLYCRQVGVWLDWVAGEELATHPKSMATFAPVELADSTYPPTLLIHGNDDEDVPYEESVAMKAKLDTLHVPNELMTIEKGKHNFDSNMEDSTSIAAVERTIKFLNKHFEMKN